jgi:hypothetical protein
LPPRCRLWQYEMRRTTMRCGERRPRGKGLVVGNIGKEAPEIDVLPTEQPVPAEDEPRPAGQEPRPAEQAPVPESDPVPA